MTEKSQQGFLVERDDLKVWPPKFDAQIPHKKGRREQKTKIVL
jgi:signal recognition particle subunit SEC65